MALATSRRMLVFPEAHIRPSVHYAWRGASLLAVDNVGVAGRDSLTGFFFRQTRFLRDLRLEVDGQPPYPCSLAAISANELELAYIFPPLRKSDGGGSGSAGEAGSDGLLLRDLDLRVRYRVHPASLEVLLQLTNRWQERAEVGVAWVLGADYATVDEAHWNEREEEAPMEAVPGEGRMLFRSLHPELPFETHVRGEGAAWVATREGLSTRLSLQRQQPVDLRLEIRAVDFEDGLSPEEERRREARLEGWRRRMMYVIAPGESPLVEIANRAFDDIGSFALLEGADDEWLTPGAGVPLYLTLWGRDALTAAWQGGLVAGGEMLADVLTSLARQQGERVDPSRDEEPGRIINQAKRDALSRREQAPFRRNYADFASPFMFIISLGYHYALTGDKEVVERHWAAARGVLEWAASHGDRDGDGYLEYLTRSEHGPTHQGWKDSENGIVDADGHQVRPPIAPCEIQGYYHVALQFMAVLSAVMGERGRGLALWRQARELKDRFNRDFWLEDEGYIALGLDADKRPIRALTSNAGQCLPTGIVSDTHIEPMVRRMFEPDLFSGWGIRTLSTANPAYHPLDYHLGTVWPVENATILFGLRRYGLNDCALELTRALYDLARLWPGGRVPECIGGYAREEHAHPGAYPRANVPQAWNQSVFAIVVQTLLGLVPYAPLKLLLVDPILPPWLPELTIRGLRVGEATVNLRFARKPNGDSEHEVTDLTGRLHVVRQPWIESRSVGLWDRLGL